MRRRWITLVLLVTFAASAAPAAANIFVIDPRKPPVPTLAADEVKKLAALQGAVFPRMLSDVSPDDAVVLTAVGRQGHQQLAFVGVSDGSFKPIQLEFPLLSNVAWRDVHTAVYISQDNGSDGAPILVALNRDSGAVVTSTLNLPGFPVSLSPNATRVLVAQENQPAQTNAERYTQSPFTITLRRSPFDRVGPTSFDTNQVDVKVSPAKVALASFDLNSQEVVPLEELPEGSGITSQAAWSADGSKLAFVRMTIPQIGREGNILSDLATQDGLGNLPPANNPFFQGNVVDAFDLAHHDLHPAFLRAAKGNGDTFAGAAWSTDGQTLMTQMQQPAQLAGRRYPTYLFPDRSYLRFYDAAGHQQKTVDRPEIDAPNASFPTFVSPDEVIIDAAVGLSYKLFYYNRVSGEFRQISQAEGTYYQVRATHQSHEVVFNYSSFQQPYELYRLQWDGLALFELTFVNGPVRDMNHIRADAVSFMLASGARRTGYVLQPANAPFPPQHTNLVVWQQGGPGGTITNEWGGNVEQPFNLLPNFGFAVLVLPLAGREGFGPQFYDDLANGRNFGSIDIDEQVEAVNQLIKRSYTSAGHVGITGCSYGGYFTSQSITRHPGVYAAANTQCTLLDLFNEWQFGYTPFVSYLEGRSPTTDGAEYTKDSPIYNAAKVRTPTLIFAGTNDFLPAQISANFHDQITANNVPATFLLFKGEGHGLSAAASQLVAGQAQIGWFRRYLSDAPAH